MWSVQWQESADVVAFTISNNQPIKIPWSCRINAKDSQSLIFSWGLDTRIVFLCMSMMTADYLKSICTMYAHSVSLLATGPSSSVSFYSLFHSVVVRNQSLLWSKIDKWKIKRKGPGGSLVLIPRHSLFIITVLPQQGSPQHRCGICAHLKCYVFVKGPQLLLLGECICESSTLTEFKVLSLLWQ